MSLNISEMLLDGGLRLLDITGRKALISNCFMMAQSQHTIRIILVDFVKNPSLQMQTSPAGRQVMLFLVSRLDSYRIALGRQALAVLVSR